MSYDDGAFPLWLIEGTDTTGDDGVFPIWIGPAIVPPTPIEDFNRIIWVSTEGDDILGNGRQFTPYRTIERALLDFKNGCQIRIMEGTYTPPDTILINGLEGSIFAETPGSVTIQPQKTTQYGAAIAILNSPRFTIQGIKIIQSNSAGHIRGIYANDVTNFIAYTCSISDFDCPSGCVGIFAYGTGKIENCTIEDINATGGDLYGIYTRGLYTIDCTVRRLTNRSTNDLIGIYNNDDYP